MRSNNLKGKQYVSSKCRNNDLWIIEFHFTLEFLHYKRNKSKIINDSGLFLYVCDFTCTEMRNELKSANQIV